MRPGERGWPEFARGLVPSSERPSPPDKLFWAAATAAAAAAEATADDNEATMDFCDWPPVDSLPVTALSIADRRAEVAICATGELAA